MVRLWLLRLLHYLLLALTMLFCLMADMTYESCGSLIGRQVRRSLISLLSKMSLLAPLVIIHHSMAHVQHLGRG